MIFELDSLFRVAIGLGTAPWHHHAVHKSSNIVKPIVNCLRDLDEVAVALHEAALEAIST